MINRKKTKKIKIGNKYIGGNAPILIQSMTNTKTSDVEKTINQIKALEKAGCEIIRVSVPDEKSAVALKRIKKEISIPLVADIHFDYRLAIKSIKYGADAIRINPGNIGNEENVKKILNLSKDKNIPIRIGVNLGSLEKNIEKEFGRTSKALVESAIKYINLFEKNKFTNLVISLKTSDIIKTIDAYEDFSKKSNYPLHLGITEAGIKEEGIVKSSIGIGYLLLNGIGDTIRVSLTSDPIEEIKVCKSILKSIGYIGGPQIISCPTCARTNVDIISIANNIQKALESCNKDIKVAVMGCAVNGPGEAKDADIGIACGNKEALVFKNGKIIGKYAENEIINKLLFEINKM